MKAQAASILGFAFRVRFLVAWGFGVQGLANSFLASARVFPFAKTPNARSSKGYFERINLLVILGVRGRESDLGELGSVPMCLLFDGS